MRPERARRALYAAAFLRATATGLVGVELALFLTRIGLDLDWVGVVLGTGLAGAAVAALLATLLADRFGRRRTLVVLALLGAVGAVAAAFSNSAPALIAAAFFGMLNGMGRDRGAALIVEQAILPSTTTAQERTQVLARYNVLQDVGHAVGALAAALPSLLQGMTADPALAHRATMLLAAALTLAPLACYALLDESVEDAERHRQRPMQPATRRTLTRLCALFAIDSLAGGLLLTSLLSYFFFERFSAGQGAIAALFFAARILNALSHFGAAWLSRRIGLVNTMVFTHIPSSVLLMTVAFAPNFPIAALLFLLREGLVEMDVPTRQSYVLAVVEPEERTRASGITNLVRLAAWAVAPTFAGMIMHGSSLMTPLLLGASMKIAYDLLLWRAFRRLPPPEERAAA
ncbi:MAG: MFS transporter [Deltaproteobacteria bacterium]|nr:MFS transporter [Deltaproteobacteria bacterium]